MTADNNTYDRSHSQPSWNESSKVPNSGHRTNRWAFLSFIVEETLAGRSSQLKGYTIAVAVYGRPERFDPQVDPIVRVEAGRLRRALDIIISQPAKMTRCA